MSGKKLPTDTPSALTALTIRFDEFDKKLTGFEKKYPTESQTKLEITNVMRRHEKDLHRSVSWAAIGQILAAATIVAMYAIQYLN